MCLNYLKWKKIVHFLHKGGEGGGGDSGPAPPPYVKNVQIFYFQFQVL